MERLDLTLDRFLRAERIDPKGVNHRQHAENVRDAQRHVNGITD